jgi:hypothetical protein
MRGCSCWGQTVTCGWGGEDCRDQRFEKVGAIPQRLNIRGRRGVVVRCAHGLYGRDVGLKHLASWRVRQVVTKHSSDDCNSCSRDLCKSERVEYLGGLAVLTAVNEAEGLGQLLLLL